MKPPSSNPTGKKITPPLGRFLRVSRPMSDAGLLVRLSSYRPREGRNSLEDFVTEAFAWLLQTNDDFQSAFLQLIAEKLAENGKQLPLSSGRSEEHTSELQSRPHLVCRLLLEKKKKSIKHDMTTS